MQSRNVHYSLDCEGKSTRFGWPLSLRNVFLPKLIHRNLYCSVFLLYTFRYFDTGFSVPCVCRYDLTLSISKKIFEDRRESRLNYKMLVLLSNQTWINPYQTAISNIIWWHDFSFNMRKWQCATKMSAKGTIHHPVRRIFVSCLVIILC